MATVYAVAPGASLLTIQRIGDTLRITCPECRAEATGAIVGGSVSGIGLGHEPGCTIFVRIKKSEREWWLENRRR
jgi:hypothetical protein